MACYVCNTYEPSHPRWCVPGYQFPLGTPGQCLDSVPGLPSPSTCGQGDISQHCTDVAPPNPIDTNPAPITSECQAQYVTGNQACQAKGRICIGSNCGGGCTDYPITAGSCGCTAICSNTAEVPPVAPPAGNPSCSALCLYGCASDGSCLPPTASNPPGSGNGSPVNPPTNPPATQPPGTQPPAACLKGNSYNSGLLSGILGTCDTGYHQVSDPSNLFGNLCVCDNAPAGTQPPTGSSGSISDTLSSFMSLLPVILVLTMIGTITSSVRGISGK
jgi:hypothetical protein